MDTQWQTESQLRNCEKHSLSHLFQLSSSFASCSSFLCLDCFMFKLATLSMVKPRMRDSGDRLQLNRYILERVHLRTSNSYPVERFSQTMQTLWTLSSFRCLDFKAIAYPRLMTSLTVKVLAILTPHYTMRKILKLTTKLTAEDKFLYSNNEIVCTTKNQVASMVHT